MVCTLLKSTKEAIRLAKEIGYPVMIKAAKSEATAAFSNDGVYLEKYIQNPRHVEFQESGRTSKMEKLTLILFQSMNMSRHSPRR
ncbi:hypothetical protein ACET3Z_029917 [Daucus carota]